MQPMFSSRSLTRSLIAAIALLAITSDAYALDARDVVSAILRSSGNQTPESGVRSTNFRPTPAPAIDEVIAAAKDESWSPQDTSSVGEAYEQTRQWVNAIRMYESSLETFPTNETLKYALRRTRVHFAIDRRYSDVSFEDQMLRQTRSESLDLMEDVLTRVQMEYVDEVKPTKFIAHGTESFYMALGNQRFIKNHNLDEKGAGVAQLKDVLVKQYWNRRIASRLEARMVVTEICDVAQREIGLPASAVVLEYLFGGCNALDDYSTFLTPDRYNELFGSIQGEFVGIGIEMEAEKGKGMHLVNVLMGSPAEDGGLRPGDHIVEVDGQDCRNMTTDEAARLLRGTRGSNVNLRFSSLGGSVDSAQLVRRAVQVRSVTRSMILDESSKVGYIKMTGFQNSTEEEMDNALRKLEQDGMQALIWDLRGNPGGLLDTAAAVIDRFIDNGVLVSTEGRSYDQNQTFRARTYNTRRIPLVLLVDGNSASASEIVAGAIHDHNRGQIVGEKTYGKWSVQSIIHLPGGTGLKLTTAKFFSPNHMNYAGKGLQPDVMVEVDKSVRKTLSRARTSQEISRDPDVMKALELLDPRYSQK